jgi:GntR family transcriptional repressor for pyruvate dehydrogenase complex
MSRLHTGAMRVVIGEIASGRYAEGELLPRELDLAARFGVSRNVARECVRGLEERGLVSVRHGSGARVRPEREWDRFDSDVLAALLGGSRAAGVIGEYLECRRILEVEAAGLAAERADEEALEDLAEAFERMRLTAEGARQNPAGERLYREADVAFHRAVIRAAGNPVLGRMTQPIHRALSETFAALARPRMRFERGLPEHERILEAVRAGDPAEAREAMRAHLLTVERYLREYSERGSAATDAA